MIETTWRDDSADGDFEAGFDMQTVRDFVSKFGQSITKNGIDISRDFVIRINAFTIKSGDDPMIILGWKLALPVPEDEWESALDAYTEGCRVFAFDGRFQLLYDEGTSSYFSIPWREVLPAGSRRICRVQRDECTCLWRPQMATISTEAVKGGR